MSRGTASISPLPDSGTPDQVRGDDDCKDSLHAQSTHFRQDGPQAPPQIFRERGVEVDEITGKTPDELAAIIGDYDGLAIRSSTKVTKAILDAATNLKVIGRAGIGVDNVDIPAASAAGVVVMNTPFGNSITTAEHAIALMFALARQLPEADASTQAGKWEKNRFMGVELTGKTLGLIGAGNIGSHRRRPRAGPQDEGDRLRSVPHRRARARNGRREGRARRRCSRAPTSSRCTPR